MNLEPEAVGGWFDPRAGYGSTTHVGHQHAGLNLISFVIELIAPRHKMGGGGGGSTHPNRF